MGMDMEFYWETASHVFRMIGIVLTGVAFQRFAGAFVREKRAASAAGITYAAVMLLLYFVPYDMSGTAAYTVGAAGVFLALLLTDRRFVRQKVFLSVTMYLVDWVAGGIALMGYECLFELLLYRPEVTARPWLEFGLYVALSFLYAAFDFLSLSLLLFLVGRVYASKGEDLSGRELALILAPSLSVLLGYWNFSYWSGVYEADMGQYIWNVHAGYEWMKLFYQLMSFAAMLAVLAIYQNIKAGQRVEKENAVLAGQQEELRRHIGEAEALYREMRGFRHDMANHVAVLESLCRSGERDEMAQYLTRMEETLGSTPEDGAGEGSPVRSGNPVTDTLLAGKRRNAEDLGITFTCDFHYPQGRGIDAYDVSVILSNALANALEAASGCEKPYIQVSSFSRKNAFVIEVRNSFKGIIVPDSGSGLPRTTKEDAQAHGFGLVNIRRVARRYQGDIDIRQEGESFVLDVMLMLR